MLLRNRCGEPSPDQMAVRNPAATLDKYRHEVREAAAHWEGEVARAGKIGSGALLSMSQAILKDLAEVRAWNRVSRRFDPDSKFQADLARRTVLGALGVSVLLRAAWADQPITPDFTGPEVEVGTLLDLVKDERVDPVVRSESRIHVPIAVAGVLPAGANEQWYRHDAVWVRQVRPAEPTGYLTGVFLPSLRLKPDFSQFETLYSYVVTK